ncbi:hypothetical protein [Pseudonocardia sp.]|uniref:hypothetical protein n=1 Tax=Pseudonocardia sp. TaxID=60912 RepID=UPI003D0D5E55
MIRRAVLAAVAAASLAACGAPQPAASVTPTAAPGTTCPAGTALHEGACIETQLRTERLTWRESNLTCLAEGRRIPALDELQTFLAGGATAVPEWHNLRYRAGQEELAGLVSGDGSVQIVAATTRQVYRCVAAPK